MTRADVPPPATPSVYRRLLRFWWLLATALLVLASAPFARSPLQDAATLEPVREDMLRRSPEYVILAPVSNVLDTLTLLSARQHIAVVVTLVLAWLAWWIVLGRRVPATVAPSRRVVRHLARAGVALASLLLVYTAAVMLPRPMAALETASDVVAIDFHAHTRYSHDGRWDWTAEDVRGWHRNAGFAVAYVTDHRTTEGARDGWANNPARAADNTLLLPGIEAVWRGEHVNLLDYERVYRGMLDAPQRDVDEDALRLASGIPTREPVLVETIPGNLDRVVPARGVGTVGVRAIEIVDGSPRGLGQGRRERARIVSIADSAGIALVAGSDHHGWGRAASAWTLMYLPAWRASPPGEVADAILVVLRRGGRSATRVVARYVADTESGIRLPFTLPIVAWGMLRTLTPEERAAWIAWLLLAFLVSRLRDWRRPIPPA